MSELRVQRDDLTEDWLARFKLDLAQLGFLPQIPSEAAPRTVKNLALFLQKKPLDRHWLD